jgi:NitT/TauT family transport system substrate-binding protein
LSADRPPFAFTQTPITALLLREQGFSTKLVAPLAEIGGTQQVIVRQASGISMPTDLQGRSIGMARGAAIFLALQHMAKDFQVDLTQVDFVNLLPHKQIEAFQRGDIDAIASWEPWTTQAQRMGGEFYFSGTQSKIPGHEGDINWLVNQSCLIVPDDNLQDSPEIAVAILNVLRKATDLLNNHRKQVADVLTDFFHVNRLDLLFAMQKNEYSMMVTNLFRLGILEFRDFLYERGQITAKLPESELYDMQYLQEVDPCLVFLEDTAHQNVSIVQENGIYYRKDFQLRPSNGGPLEFLIADDSRFVRTSLNQAVTQVGGTIIGEATSGSEILQQFAHKRSDVITMDLSMPGVSGIEAIKIITQMDPDVNIVVISGIDLQEVRNEMFDLGVKMFITKPFDIAEITRIWQKAMRTS